MNKTKATPSHKLGANRKEPAKRKRQKDHNFAQSRDIREDRGERQAKFVHNPMSIPNTREAPRRASAAAKSSLTYSPDGRIEYSLQRAGLA